MLSAPRSLREPFSREAPSESRESGGLKKKKAQASRETFFASRLHHLPEFVVTGIRKATDELRKTVETRTGSVQGVQHLFATFTVSTDS